MNSKTMLVVAILLTPITLMANGKGKLEGEYELGSAIASTGIPREDKSILHIRLMGDVAKTLYTSSKTAPKKNDCTGYTHKTAGDFDCYELRSEQSYVCLFAINLEENTVETSRAC